VMKSFAALPSCLVGMEACATAHYWARELTKLGHEVRLMPGKDVKAYVSVQFAAFMVVAALVNHVVEAPRNWRLPERRKSNIILQAGSGVMESPLNTFRSRAT
jgi:transposase